MEMFEMNIFCHNDWSEEEDDGWGLEMLTQQGTVLYNKALYLSEMPNVTFIENYWARDYSRSRVSKLAVNDWKVQQII